MIVLVTGLVALFAAIDFVEPGEVDLSILYGLCVAICAWSRSPRFLWVIAATCVFLTFAGFAFGPAPITGDRALRLLWIDRTLVAIKLVVLAIFVRLWMRRSKQLRAASTLLQEKNDALSANLRQAQKMEAIGQLSEGIAHDFKNVLTVIIGSLELIAAGRGDEAREQRLIGAALEAAHNATALVQRLLAFARPAPPAEPVALDALLRRALPQWQRALGVATELAADLPQGLWRCRLDPARFEAAILNLAVNARDAMPDGGRIAIRVENATIAPQAIAGLRAGDYLLASVADNGPGIPPEVMAKLFNPFFTTKGPGKGSGLGLWMVRNFAEEYGGTALLDSSLGIGTTVKLYLPRA